jgi:hypothetical protein
MENNCEVETKTVIEKPFFKSWEFWKPFVGIALGSLGGFLYYYFDGNGGIGNNLFASTFYGGLFGLFIVKSPCSRGRC